MTQVCYSRVLRLAAILMPALIAGLVAQLPTPAAVRADPALIVFVETWNGNIDTNWNNASNWTPNGVPTNLLNCYIPGGRPNYPLLTNTGTGTCSYITIESGGEIDLMNGGTLQASHTIVVSGTLSVIGNCILEADTLIAVKPGGLLDLHNTAGTVRFTSNGFLSVSGIVQLENSITGNQMSGPNPPTQTANLIVNRGGLVNIPDNAPFSGVFSLDGSVTNNGTMSQSLSVSSPTSFLSITPAYLGLVITPSADMGSTSVSVQGNQTCDLLPQGIRRCYMITPTNSLSSTVQFFYLPSEANVNLFPSVFQFTGLFGWLPYLDSTRGGTAPNLFARAAGIGFYLTPFELKNVSTSFLPLVRR